jgi:hypothetical protein
MKRTMFVVPLLVLAVACSSGGHRALPPPTSTSVPTPTTTLPAHGKIVGSIAINTLGRSSQVPGTVTLVGTAGRARLFATTGQGTFAIEVTPGTYVVTAHTPSFTYSANGGPSTQGTCSAAPTPTAVAADAIVRVEVICLGR